MYSLWETFESRSAVEALDNASTIDRTYVVHASDQNAALDDDAVKAFLAQQTSIFYQGLRRKSATLNRIGPRLWHGTLRYVDPDRNDEEEKREVGEFTFGFDTTGGTVHITQAKSQAGFAKQGEQAPEFQGAIGVTADGVQGVDIVVPSLQFEMTYRIPKATLTLQYARTVADLTGRYNASQFYSFAPGELLFMGANGRDSTIGDPECTYYFKAEANITGLAVGEIQNITKRGHDYLWVYYEEVEDPQAKRIVQQPSAVYVAEVSDPGDFSLLGIGG